MTREARVTMSEAGMSPTSGVSIALKLGSLPFMSFMTSVLGMGH